MIMVQSLSIPRFLIPCLAFFILFLLSSSIFKFSQVTSVIVGLVGFGLTWWLMRFLEQRK
ncbi:hypothetical protein D6817_03410 [Candidatus Pacearchaeota archaeon]|nr:MAG: hypothetical protein D6817_03410 [Candidatus Pacearchaeota archaeon]